MNRTWLRAVFVLAATWARGGGGPGFATLGAWLVARRRARRDASAR